MLTNNEQAEPSAEACFFNVFTFAFSVSIALPPKNLTRISPKKESSAHANNQTLHLNAKSAKKKPRSITKSKPPANLDSAFAAPKFSFFAAIEKKENAKLKIVAK